MELYQIILSDFNKIPNIKTKDIDDYNKKLIKNNTDVSSLRPYILKYPLLHRTYFQVSMKRMKNSKDQLLFVEKNLDLLNDWWHVDQLTQFVTKPVDFDFAFDRAKAYVNSPQTFTRRWGYVLFLAGLQKDQAHTKDILTLLKDDDEYYVQMAEAWLIADLMVFNREEVISYLQTCPLKYNISGKAIQKICDSFRISREDKTYLKTLREKLKQN